MWSDRQGRQADVADAQYFLGSSVHGLQGELKKNRKIHILIVSSERLTWSDRPTHGACSAQQHAAWLISHVALPLS